MAEPAPILTGREAEPGVRVLLLEDDPFLRRSFMRRLRSAGFEVDVASTLAEARQAVRRLTYDCLVLDRLVPDGDAIVLAAELSALAGRAPVIVLSALGDASQRVEGLLAGVDDYLAKPVSLEELVERVRKMVELAPSAAAADLDPLVQVGSVVFDRLRREVSVAGRPVHLTPRQLAVLEYLMLHAGQLVRVEEVLEHCWDGGRSLFSNPLTSQVTRLRAIFRGSLRIEAVRGAGYLLEPAGPGWP